MGIIPALAGNTAASTCRSSRPTDHPRSRGEYMPSARAAAYSSGSSPLSRGIPPHSGDPAGAGRIIPALAGNTMVTHAFQFRNGDHPRSRGEYRRSLRELNLAAGSSPLSRGIRGADALQKPLVRIIPALAGNTNHETMNPTADWGSSPLSRGIPVMTTATEITTGIIPALAGTTAIGT